MTQTVIIEERRRRWPPEEKKRIVEETFDPHVTVTEIAHRHNIPKSQLFQWRKWYRERVSPTQSAQFVPVSIDPTPVGSASAPGPPPDRIELMLSNGRQLSVPVSFDARRLGRLANILEGR